ncbi:MAG: sulfite exporter TauE/SafE family protein, partial [Alphaproteobacteria bacterium]|nr:sulfite exporter TauE/SafE family protein [Alphaproteobacteria bacterium]
MIAAVVAVLIAGISKGGLGGGGLTILSVPLMSLFVPPPQAAAIILPVLCAMDAMGIWVYRKKWSAINMRILIPAATVGIAVGALLFKYLNADAIRLMIGVLALMFSLNWWLNRKRPRPPARPSISKGGFW